MPAEFHQPLRQGDIQQFHIVKADDIGNGEQRHKRHAQNKYKIAAQQPASAARPALLRTANTTAAAHSTPSNASMPKPR